jgi:hypothetical protein
LNIIDIPASNKDHITAWSDLATGLLRDSGEKYVWRGVTNSTWCLTASLDRFLTEAHLADKAKTKSVLAKNFRRAMSRIGRTVSDNDDECWALAQHLGLPTPMLDWTHSPWIAAYFAVTGMDASTPPARRTAVLWRLDSDAVPDSSSDVRKVPVEAGNRNTRLLAQEGLFTESLKYACLIKALDELGKLDVLYAYTFPMAIAEELMTAVRSMLITDSRLFPDEVGAVREARTQTLREVM